MMGVDIVLRHAGSVTEAGPFRLTPKGLEVVGEPSFEEWQACWDFVQQVLKRVQWWVGDLLNYRERRWGMYDHAIELTGLDKTTLQDIKWVCGVVESSRRREDLSFAHHREVASFPAAEADAILARAESEGLTRQQVRAIVKQVKAAASPREPPPFVIVEEFDAVLAWLRDRLSSWPPEHRRAFVPLVTRALEQLELPHVDHGGAGQGSAAADAGAA